MHKIEIMPDHIEVEFTEWDRQNAEPFDRHRSCLLATALGRMGYDVVSVSSVSAMLATPFHWHDYAAIGAGPSDLKSKTRIFFKNRKPHYRRSVVGKKVLLLRK